MGHDDIAPLAYNALSAIKKAVVDEHWKQGSRSPGPPGLVVPLRAGGTGSTMSDCWRLGRWR